MGGGEGGERGEGRGARGGEGFQVRDTNRMRRRAGMAWPGGRKLAPNPPTPLFHQGEVRWETFMGLWFGRQRDLRLLIHLTETFRV